MGQNRIDIIFIKCPLLNCFSKLFYTELFSNLINVEFIKLSDPLWVYLKDAPASSHVKEQNEIVSYLCLVFITPVHR